MRDRLFVLGLLALQASCTLGERVALPPRLDEVSPRYVLADRPSMVELRGENFLAALDPELTSNAPHRVDYGFEVRIGEVVLGGDVIRFIDTTRIEVDAPALPTGTFDVSVRLPGGSETTLEDALHVVTTLPVQRLVFVTPEVVLPAGDCSQELRVELQNGEGSPVLQETVTLLGVGFDDPAAQVFADAGCNEAVERVQVEAGTSFARFFVSGRLIGEPVVQARLDELSADQVARFTPAQNCAGLPDQFACDDGLSCTTGESCLGGLCRAPDWSSCPMSAPPRACFTATPLAAKPLEEITFDASCTTDSDDAVAQLRARYDFDADGVWDTSFSELGSVVHAYPFAGVFQPMVEVRDVRGASGYTQRMLVVTSDVILVTTAADETTSGATPQNPGGTGLSLREAISFVNSRGTASTIRIPDGWHLQSNALPGLASEGASIVGGPGVRIDFTQNSGSNCFQLDAPNTRIVGLHAVGCSGHIVELKYSGSQVVDCHFEGPATALKLGGPGAIVGPRNLFTGFDDGVIQVKASGGTIIENVFTRNGGEVVNYGQGSGGTQLLARNVFYENPGVCVYMADEPGFSAWFNTFHKNATDAIRLASADSPVDVRGNVFSENAGYGINSPASLLSYASPNAFFGNTSGEVSGMAPQSGWVTSAPGFLDAAGGDFRPSWDSPLIDKGVNVGVDVNGPLPGSYSGQAPDLGANEVR